MTSLSHAEIATMGGAEVLAYLRDLLAEESERIRTLEIQCASIGREIYPGRVRARLAIEAAANVFTLVLAAGQMAKTDNKPPPGWVKRIADQARAVFIMATAARKETASGEITT